MEEGKVWYNWRINVVRKTKEQKYVLDKFNIAKINENYKSAFVEIDERAKL